MALNIEHKIENEGNTAQGRLSAEECNQIIGAINDLESKQINSIPLFRIYKNYWQVSEDKGETWKGITDEFGNSIQASIRGNNVQLRKTDQDLEWCEENSDQWHKLVSLQEIKGVDGTVSFDKLTPSQIDGLRGKDGVIAYPTMRLNPTTGHLVLSIPTNNFENRFKVINGHLILVQDGK